MQLTCPQCNAAINGADINVQTSVAKCARCHEVFNFAAQVGATTGQYSKPVAGLPRGFAVTQDLSDYVITRKWFSPKYFALLFFCIFWDGFLVFWYAMAAKSGGPVVMFVFPLLHVAVGLGLTYVVLAGFFNQTDIRLNGREIRVRHYPLPWPGNRVIEVGRLAQVFCEEKYSQTRHGSSTTYNVSLVFTDDTRLSMITGLDAMEEALYIEQQIESRLGITDRAVAGEMRLR